MVDDEHVMEKEHLRLEKAEKRTPVIALDQVERQGLPAFMQEIESQLIQEALALNGENISRAAAQLGIKRQTL